MTALSRYFSYSVIVIESRIARQSIAPLSLLALAAVAAAAAAVAAQTRMLTPPEPD